MKRIEKNYYEIITCKFEGDRNLYVIESTKLSMLLKIFMINFVGKLSIKEDEAIILVNNMTEVIKKQ